MTRITLHMVASLDGFIARGDNDVAWLESAGCQYEPGASLTQEEIAAFLRSIDCYVMGSRTYEHALRLGWPYGDTPVVVVTTRQLQPIRPGVEFYSGDLAALVRERLAPRFTNVWLAGGALLGQRFLDLGLVEELRLTVAPVRLGEGVPFFGQGRRVEERWELQGTTAYQNGFVELHYRCARPPQGA